MNASDGTPLACEAGEGARRAGEGLAILQPRAELAEQRESAADGAA